MGKKQRKPRKGQTIRPCHVCKVPVNFVLWEEETMIRGRKIYHWANEDGTHHVHAYKADSDRSQEMKHIAEIAKHG